MEDASERAGLRLAEHRAWINALKSDRRRFKLQQRTILSLYKDILNNVDTPIEIQHRFDVFLSKYKKDIEDIDTNIKIIEKAIQEEIKLRDKILNRSKENKES